MTEILRVGIFISIVDLPVRVTSINIKRSHTDMVQLSIHLLPGAVINISTNTIQYMRRGPLREQYMRCGPLREQYNAMQCNATQLNTNNTTQHNTTQHNTIQYNKGLINTLCQSEHNRIHVKMKSIYQMDYTNNTKKCHFLFPNLLQKHEGGMSLMLSRGSITN